LPIGVSDRLDGFQRATGNEHSDIDSDIPSGWLHKIRLRFAEYLFWNLGKLEVCLETRLPEEGKG